ncbi:hypothetical protein T439DRAFT_345230 [Meredithblackwellia eburnea MCA 4105]
MARISFLVLLAAASTAFAQSLSPFPYRCATEDNYNAPAAGSPLCSEDYTPTLYFTCYYSQNFDRTGCVQSSKYYCEYSKDDGHLVEDHDFDNLGYYCPTVADVAPFRRLMARNGTPALPEGQRLGKRNYHDVATPEVDVSKRGLGKGEPVTLSKRAEERAAKIAARLLTGKGSGKGDVSP